MSQQIRCSGCEAVLKVSSQIRASKVRCPRCQTVVEVPTIPLAEPNGSSVSDMPVAANGGGAAPTNAAPSMTAMAGASKAVPPPLPGNMPTAATIPAAAAAFQPAAPAMPQPPASPQVGFPAAVAEPPSVHASAVPYSAIATAAAIPVAAGVPQISAASPMLEKAGERSERLSRYTKKRGISIPVWVWFAVPCIALLAVVGVLGMQQLGEENKAPVATPRLAESKGEFLGAGDGTLIPETADGRAIVPRKPRKIEPYVPPENAADFVKRPPDGAPFEDVAAYVEQAIVEIECYDNYRNRRAQGAGFVIDPRGLVVTNYHVMSAGFNGDVLFHDGTRYGIEGYVAAHPEIDLAIVKLNGIPPGMQILELQQDPPRKGSEAYAFGHPLDHKFTLTGGMVTNILKTSELPPESQSFLHQSLSTDIDHLWIQHQADLSPGNSGGPLFNKQGFVLGINTWVSMEPHFGYAIQSKHLQQIIDNLPDEVIPLSTHFKPDLNVLPVDTAAIQLSPARIRELQESLVQQNWQVGDDRAFQELQELARLVTIARYLTGKLEGDRVAPPIRSLLSSIEQVEEGVAKYAWDNSTHVQPINARAVEFLETKEIDGLGFVAKVVDNITAADTTRGVVMQLADREELLFVALSETQSFPPENARVFVFGMSSRDVFRITENGTEREMRLIHSRSIVPLQ